jgi:hypothetical protein
VVDEVDRLVDVVGLDDVDAQVAEVLRADVLCWPANPFRVVDADDAIAAPQQLVAEVGSEESGAPGD